MTNTYSILLTIDVEDWFQVENFKQCIPYSSWQDCELRVEKNTHRILDLFDSIKLDNSSSPQVARQNSGRQASPSEPRTPDPGPRIRATFFVLGWIAERLPHLVQEIHSRGHEIASHGYCHTLCSNQQSDALKEDLVASKKLLEDLSGLPVRGYRAPSFFIDSDILRLIESCEYRYDSSYNSFSIHDRYGHVDLTPNSKKGIVSRISNNFFELPVSNLTLGKHVFPWAGGGYFRLIPFHLFKRGVMSILKTQKAYLFYLHPWEVDPEQPRVSNTHTFLKFRHYANLAKTAAKLSAFINTFRACEFVTCSEYLGRYSMIRSSNAGPPDILSSNILSTTRSDKHLG